jgi:ParB/RepB/Spo0J family partition protein
MREMAMENRVSRIAIDRLVAHPDNPNQMSKTNFAKLVRNIERTGRYEPLVVRPFPQRPRSFQIISGHHRWQALVQLGCKTADVIVWDIDDEQADILLATLNRLGGSDALEKKLALLKRLNTQMEAGMLAKLLPQTTKQIERLTSLASGRSSLVTRAAGGKKQGTAFANPLVFFVKDKQQEIVENALSLAQSRYVRKNEKTKACKRAGALAYIAQYFLTQKSTHESGP